MRSTLFKAALRATVPVMLGYLAIGTAFGLMLADIGYGPGWAGLMSVVIYAGSMQYLAVPLIAAGAGLWEVALTTFVVQSRHLLYGLSLLEKFENMGRKKPYMIFSLTDETYALLSAAEAPDKSSASTYYFMIALLNHSYWITGSIIGAAAGSLFDFNTKGISFAMTALFIVIATDQLRSSHTPLPSLFGAGCAALSLLLFGAQGMLLPAMAGIVLLLMLARPRIEKGARE